MTFNLPGMKGLLNWSDNTYTDSKTIIIVLANYPWSTVKDIMDLTGIVVNDSYMETEKHVAETLEKLKVKGIVKKVNKGWNVTDGFVAKYSDEGDKWLDEILK